jgi:hypothetical protein
MEIKAEKINRQLKKNFSFAFIEQAVSLVVSCVMNLILPKYLSINDYSYWQLFVFYANYVPCLALGLNEGIYLRLGGADIHHIDYRSVKSQFCFGFIYQGSLPHSGGRSGSGCCFYRTRFCTAAGFGTFHPEGRDGGYGRAPGRAWWFRRPGISFSARCFSFLSIPATPFSDMFFRLSMRRIFIQSRLFINRLLFLGVQCSLIMLNSVNVYWLMLLYILDALFCPFLFTGSYLSFL